jgi:hypothetical protein
LNQTARASAVTAVRPIGSQSRRGASARINVASGSSASKGWVLRVGKHKKQETEKSTATELESETLDFTIVYFDTCVLVSNNWPVVSRALESLFQLADFLDVKCYIPAPVVFELEEVWLREGVIAEQKLNRHLRRIQAPAAQNFSDRSVALKKYNEANAQAVEDFGVQISPMTNNSLEELIRRSTAQHPPFDDSKDDLFGDRVIWMSVIEHLEKMPATTSAVFVTDNRKDFHREAFRKLGEACSNKIRIVSMEDAKRFLDERLRHKIARYQEEKWAHEKASLLELAKSASSTHQIREFISNNLVIYDAALREIKRLKSISVFSASTSPKLGPDGKPDFVHGFARKAGDVVRASLDVDVELEVSVRMMSHPLVPSKPLKIGEEVSPVAARGIGAVSLFSELAEDKIWKVKVRVDCAAHVATGSTPVAPSRVVGATGFRNLVPESLQVLSVPNSPPLAWSLVAR